MPPPMSPQARPRFTARTVWFSTISRQPSWSSERVRRSATFTSRFSEPVIALSFTTAGSSGGAWPKVRRWIIQAENRNVHESTTKASAT